MLGKPVPLVGNDVGLVPDHLLEIFNLSLLDSVLAGVVDESVPMIIDVPILFIEFPPPPSSELFIVAVASAFCNRA